MKILFTGGTGFIGSAAIRHLIQDTQDSVINLDNLTYVGYIESLRVVTYDARNIFEQVDICDRAELDRSITGPAEFIQTNIVGTYTLLESLREYWNILENSAKQTFHFHHISTDEVYGDLPCPDEVHTVYRSSGPQNIGQDVGLKTELQDQRNTYNHKSLIIHSSDRPGHDTELMQGR